VHHEHVSKYLVSTA